MKKKEFSDKWRFENQTCFSKTHIKEKTTINGRWTMGHFQPILVTLPSVCFLFKPFSFCVSFWWKLAFWATYTLIQSDYVCSYWNIRGSHISHFLSLLLNYCVFHSLEVVLSFIVNTEMHPPCVYVKQWYGCCTVMLAAPFVSQSCCLRCMRYDE